MAKFFSYLFCLFFVSVSAQELNCTVTINTKSLANSDQKIFKTLEKAISEFVNNNKWSEVDFGTREKIDCSMHINISTYSSDQFIAILQVSSSRPVYDSSYSAPVFNYNDKDFSFKYVEYESMYFNPNSFDSNLISVLAYYCNMILGFDADTFELKGGTKYYQKAQEIVNTAQSSNYKGWKQTEVNQSRYYLVNDILSGTYDPLRIALFDYHFKGLDIMSNDPNKAKSKIKDAVLVLEQLHSVRPNAFLTRVFFDAKADEIVGVFSGGPKISITDLLDSLNKISPINSTKWANIKF